MKPAIKTFLTELYEIDPDLKEHEQDLIPLIEQLLANDPAQAPDAAFVQRLRMQLQDRSSELSSSSMKQFSLSNLFYALGGAVAVAVLLPVAYLGFQQGSYDAETPLFGYQVEKTGNKAFGNLKDLAATGQGGMGGARTQSGGGGGNIAPEAASLVGGDAVVSDKMLVWPMILYEYSYAGELPELSSSVDVFKRTPSASRVPLSAIGAKLNMGIIDLASFSGLNVESLSFLQNTSFGYQLYVDLRNASISVNQNWEQWPQSKCQTEACYKAEQVKISQILPDADVIGIAKNFAQEHGIDLSDYGEPEVDNQWKKIYDKATDKSTVWVPDVQRVTFPFLIEGKPVHDQGGVTSGISIGVSVKYKKVSDIYGIMDRTYQSSSYDGVTDAAAIKTFISKLDNYQIDAMPRGSQGEIKKVKVILDTPVVGYAMYYRWADNMNQELVIPSLIFPVKSVEGDDQSQYYRQSVVVPLAKEMLSEMSNLPPVMPLTVEDGVRAQDAAASSDAGTSSVSE